MVVFVGCSCSNDIGELYLDEAKKNCSIIM